MTPLRRALSCLALASALAACQTPASSPAAPSPAAPGAVHAASAPDAGAQDAAPAAAQRPTHPTDEAARMPSDGAQTLLLKDSGVRCITFPCPSYSVQAPGEKEPREVHELDLSALGSDAEREGVQKALQQGVRVEGTLSVRPKAGPAGDATVLRVTRVLK
ncbi:hypothetical protein FGE12_22810 [Aggregicoccus sp. 17bor-14]|uniref:DUF6748 domain-containing protein n=1 Tax=Myxococcaceae TaxID=31 RepID=UPI00129CA55E|nr:MULTISPECIES: DUF6748 domain-containing protein [Myxococcaceae]MBF5045254.1 hypothetical protein [Simulacricoccus sp. 17bor-14]MRI90995.1 hypothetical protein [Aggregicoccus sp. 17bor-14]